jgi:hypothetical protein
MQRRVFIAGTGAVAAMGLAHAVFAQASSSPGVKRLAVFHPTETLEGLTIKGDVADLMRRVADMTDQVLRGVKPSDIPFYQATKCELVLNQKVATSLGLQFPPTLLTAADEVIE